MELQRITTNWTSLKLRLHKCLKALGLSPVVMHLQQCYIPRPSVVIQLQQEEI